MELAIVTNTAPRDWWDEDPVTVLTAVAVLEEKAKLERRAARGR